MKQRVCDGGKRKHEQAAEVRAAIAAYPDLPNRTLAKVLVKRFPLRCSSVDRARDSVRYHRGRAGREHLRYAVSSGAILPYNAKRDIPARPEYTNSETNWTPYTIPPDRKRGLILADMHIPYHEPKVITAACDDAETQGHTDFVILDGDVWDNYWFSKFSRRISQRAPKKEATTVMAFLDALRERFPKALIVFKEGNHDERWAQMVNDKAAWVIEWMRAFGWDDDDTPLSLPFMLRLKERGITFIGDKRPIRVGHLWVVHGDEWRFGNVAVNPARTAYLRTKACTLVAHSHIASAHTEVVIDGKLIATWSLGCMCYLHPRYWRVNNWSWSYALVGQDKDDQFNVLHKRIGPKYEVWTC